MYSRLMSLNAEQIVSISGVRVIANTTQVFFIIPKHFLQCRKQPKQYVRQDCCNSPEIYFYILLIVHMTLINAFNAIT